jgi:biotin carboxyl carrier protein
MNEYIVTTNSRKYSVKLTNQEEAEVNGKKIPIELIKLSHNAYLLKYGNKVFEICTDNLSKDKYGFLIAGWYYTSVVRTKLQESVAEFKIKVGEQHSKASLVSPMPGLILKLKKKIGEYVDAGESLIILEAMKMENELKSPISGVISKVNVTEGQSVEKNTELIIITK